MTKKSRLALLRDALDEGRRSPFALNFSLPVLGDRVSEAAKLEQLRADVAIAREQVRRGEMTETTAEAFLSRNRSGTGP